MFTDVVWPELSPLIGGGEYLPVEAATTGELEKALDVLIGIDGYQINHERGFGRGVAARVSFVESSFDTFTVRYKRRNELMTEWDKRVKALDRLRRVGSDVPFFTVHAYVNLAGDQLLAACTVRTVDLIRYAKKWLDADRRDRLWIEINGRDGTQFLVIPWDGLAAENVLMSRWSVNPDHNLNTLERSTDMPEQHSNQAGIFVRLADDGDSVVGAFCGDPILRELHWVDDKYEDCQGEECAHCRANSRKTMKVALNLYVPASMAMKIIEGGIPWFMEVLKVREKYGLDDWLFEIKRHGVAGDLKTTYSIKTDGRIDNELRERIVRAELHDIEQIMNRRKAALLEFTPIDIHKVSPEVKDELISKLRPMSQPKVDRFLKEFDVQLIKNLRACDEHRARAFITDLSRLPGEPA
ncbi:MAG: hypothetical protein GY854_01540 [Deltaproteobacteria bacterium]|nr:hypothetical protein [Deltaproteobacteria bacterium]